MLSLSNININLDSKITTPNGEFIGLLTLNDGDKSLIGILDYSNFNGIKIDGNITIDADLLKSFTICKVIL